MSGLDLGSFQTQSCPLVDDLIRDVCDRHVPFVLLLRLERSRQFEILDDAIADIPGLVARTCVAFCHEVKLSRNVRSMPRLGLSSCPVRDRLAGHSFTDDEAT